MRISRRSSARTGNGPKGSPTTTSRWVISPSTRSSSLSSSSFFQDHLSDRVLGSVRDGEVHDLGPAFGEDAKGLPADVQRRNPFRIVPHLDVGRGDLPPPARFYRLQE